MRGSLAAVRAAVPPRYRDAALFVVLAGLFGGSFVAIKTGLRELPPVLFAGLRFDLAALALLGYVAVARPRSTWLPRTREDVLGIAVAAVFLVVLNNGLLFLGQETTTPAAASVMYGLNPVLAPVFAWWLLGDRLSWLGTLGIAVALAGVVLIVQPSPSTFADESAVGQVLVLGAAAAVALGSVALQRVGTTMESVSLTAWAMAVGAVLLHALSVGVGEAPGQVLAIGATTAWSVVLVAIPSTAVAYAIYFGLIERVGPVRTNLVAYVVPVFAAAMGWLLLDATISSTTVVGFLVVVAGFALVERETIRAELGRVRRRSRPSSGGASTDDGECTLDATSGRGAGSPDACDD
ncbi:DMT family transporter [Halorubellus sp. PRR65]|uniref:DMT family transporter n=1 Tax=Halorubellus sp. PRR65 TaxID=3098148 RepID=UPI002B25D39A|nr:DMT family transporter [Halorubellus sp. PRR65]